MSYPTASGVPNLSGNYLPIVYASMLLVEFYTSTVFGQIASTEFEGQIANYGDKLRIRMLPDIVSKEYVKGQELEYQDGDPSYVDLDIDKGRYWGLRFNALDKKQSDLNYIQKWAAHAAEIQKIAIDAGILADVYGDVSSYNKGTTAGKKSASINLGVSGTPLQVSDSTIVDKIVDCGVVLDEQDVPSENRWIVLPAWACGMIKTSELKDASLAGDDKSMLRSGHVGKIDRFDIYMSNNIESVTDGGNTVYNAIFGWKGSLAFASQMLLTESLKNPKDFGDLMRSLQAYGYKTVKPEGMGHLYIRK